MNIDYNERAILNKQLREVESAPLSDRHEGRNSWRDALTDPKFLVERIEWLIDGNYGYGSYQAVRQILTNKRMNRTAYLGQMIAALEWQCPNNYARSEWLKLTTEKQAEITALINAEIESAIDQLVENGECCQKCRKELTEFERERKVKFCPKCDKKHFDQVVDGL